MSQRHFARDLEQEFTENRATALGAVNANTFWSIAIVLLAFGAWDAYVDPERWWTAFQVRLAGAAIIVATGLFQKLPGKLHWLPLMAKIRLLTAVVASLIAALMLGRGYGFGVAGVAVIMLTGPYLALDARDLLITNFAVLLAVGGVVLAAQLSPFDAVGTIVFVLLASLVSLLLARVIEASNRRAFALELELHRDARTDALTGLSNRRAMEERGPLELKRAQRAGTPVSVILCDVDHFKSINDRFGHDLGDTVLKTAASVLRSALRDTDALGRWGGEEFIVVLNDTGVQVAGQIAERMRAAIAGTKFSGLPDGATISLGVSTLVKVGTPATAWDGLIKEADSLLYQAKKEGRNRVIYTQA